MTNEEIERFLAEPRLAMLLYHGPGPSPLGVPVWFDWDGNAVLMFSARTSPKIEALKRNPNVSVLVTNRVGEPEGWVAFDGEAVIGEFAADEWTALIDRVAPRYWDLSHSGYHTTIDQWRAAPEAFASLTVTPSSIRSGA